MNSASRISVIDRLREKCGRLGDLAFEVGDSVLGVVEGAYVEELQMRHLRFGRAGPAAEG